MGSFAINSHLLEESPNTFMGANEEANGGMVFATRLLARAVQAIPGLLTRSKNSQCLHGRV